MDSVAWFRLEDSGCLSVLSRMSLMVRTLLLQVSAMTGSLGKSLKRVVSSSSRAKSDEIGSRNSESSLVGLHLSNEDGITRLSCL